MTLTLSSAEQARLAATARALLSPLDAVSTDRWRGEVLGQLAELLEADGAGFILPALEAGLAARVRLAGQRRALEKAFDAARYGLAVYDVHGRRLYTNEALPELLRRDPQPERLIGALQMGVRSVASLTGPAGDAPAQALGNASRELRTADARYRLRLNLIGEGLFASGPAILATLERLTPEPPSRRTLRERWGLTPQEARVALLLARGGTNRQIAERMDLSPATIRHYTEALFRKVDVHSRAEATARILTG